MLYVAIGRNVHGAPMSDEAWGHYRDAVCVAVGLTPDTLAYGGSRWGGEVEQTCVMVWFGVDALSESARARFEFLAGLYSQDAIAWSVSEIDFVLPLDKDVTVSV